MEEKPKSRTGRRLTQDEKDRIVELKLNGSTVRQIAAEMDCAVNTVTATFNQWLDREWAQRQKHNERELQKIVSQLRQNAFDARKQYVILTLEGDHSTAQRYLESERKAMIELGKFGALRDGEADQAGKVTAAQAEALASALKASVDSANLPPAERAQVLTALIQTLRNLN